MKKLRGAVVGAGYFSQFHFDSWNRIALGRRTDDLAARLFLELEVARRVVAVVMSRQDPVELAAARLESLEEGRRNRGVDRAGLAAGLVVQQIAVVVAEDGENLDL